jgi:predicted DNA repair protein MutK
MPGASLLTLLDDIAGMLDQVSLLTKVAAKKTAGVLGDDLALNAQQVAGVRADRELPVVWAVAKGSFLNKAILVPAALAISALAPWAVTPLLMIGGAYLCFEGVEKVAHRYLHDPAEEAAKHAGLLAAASDPKVDLVALERDTIKGAIRTDFILSAEIVTISLGTVTESTLLMRFAVLSSIAIVMTVGVYGLVAGIVKLDDLGAHLTRPRNDGSRARWRHPMGAAILRAAPLLMKALSIGGTIAMFLVGGGILTHGVAPLQRGIDGLGSALGGVEVVGGVLKAIVPAVLDAGVGVVAGAVVLAVYEGVKRARR